VIDQRIRLLGLHRQPDDQYGGPTCLVLGPSEGNTGEATA
jgi:hypothetical protein